MRMTVDFEVNQAKTAKKNVNEMLRNQLAIAFYSIHRLELHWQ